MAYQVTAQNHAEASENKIHENTVAARYGFTGALVPGVAVYGYLTHEVVERFGEAWLSQSTSEVRFLKPAYQGDKLTIIMKEQNEELLVECHNQNGVLLAVLKTKTGPPTDSGFSFDQPPFQSEERTDLCWDNLQLDNSFTPFTWQLSPSENLRYVNQVSDTLDIYSQGYLHPHLILSQANTVLTRKFIMPAWIHVGSCIRVYEAIKQNDTVMVCAKPNKKWQTKGHDFVLLDLAYIVNGKTLVEIEHTAIFKIAEPA